MNDGDTGALDKVADAAQTQRRRIHHDQFRAVQQCAELVANGAAGDRGIEPRHHVVFIKCDRFAVTADVVQENFLRLVNAFRAARASGGVQHARDGVGAGAGRGNGLVVRRGECGGDDFVRAGCVDQFVAKMGGERGIEWNVRATLSQGREHGDDEVLSGGKADGEWRFVVAVEECGGALGELM